MSLILFFFFAIGNVCAFHPSCVRKCFCFRLFCCWPRSQRAACSVSKWIQIENQIVKIICMLVAARMHRDGMLVSGWMVIWCNMVMQRSSSTTWNYRSSCFIRVPFHFEHFRWVHLCVWMWQTQFFFFFSIPLTNFCQTICFFFLFVYFLYYFAPALFRKFHFLFYYSIFR